MEEDPYALLVRLLRRIAPEIDLDEVDRADPLQDVADLDSMDFLSLMAALYGETGIEVPEPDYPAVASVDGFVDYVRSAALADVRSSGKTESSPTADRDRAVPLDEDWRIIIRPVRKPDDVDLMTLYGSLDDDDQYHRFLGSYQPPFSFFTAMATEAQRGGARLVAVLQGPAPTEDRIVGEAGYTVLPNGDGELGIVVGKRWRGWLGPYLLDALVDVAAAAGVPNLEADVLTANRPMTALLQSRGSVVMEHEDWKVVRLLIGTRNRMPSWPGAHDRPRVLVEGAGGRWHGEDDARAAGLQVLNCPGPRDGPHGCPALAGKPCPLAAEADVVVVSHPSDEPRWHDLLTAHASIHPGVPVCLEPSQLPVNGDVAATVCPMAGAEGVVSFVRQLARPPATRDESASGSATTAAEPTASSGASWPRGTDYLRPMGPSTMALSMTEAESGGMTQPSSRSRSLESIFAIPCPDCGEELVACGEFSYRCPGCGEMYEHDLGYLLPIGHSAPRK